ncbi:MAG: phosphoribosylanthranilate isomerase [Alicyclobacillaceae bacterium]|nr:phosphoribosylanthranilate isomerase [Alicyclobacillaceae bacterium]
MNAGRKQTGAGHAVGLKICGLRPGDDTGFTAHPVVRYVGVVLVPASRRFVPPAAARAITGALADGCRAIGVSVDADEAWLVDALEAAGLHGVQLHGAESPALCERLKARGYIVWRALPVAEDRAGVPSVARQLALYADVVDAILLDAAPPKGAARGVTGGHGRPFDWSLLPEIVEAAGGRAKLPALWVAGGLTPANVPALFRVFRPDGVDVSSGVEENGRKSPALIQAMIEVVSGHGWIPAIP